MPSTPQAIALLVPGLQAPVASQQPEQLVLLHLAGGGLVVPHEEMVATEKPNAAPMTHALNILNLSFRARLAQSVLPGVFVCARVHTSP
jgi:hypothetical protein